MYVQSSGQCWRGLLWEHRPGANKSDLQVRKDPHRASPAEPHRRVWVGQLEMGERDFRQRTSGAKKVLKALGVSWELLGLHLGGSWWWWMGWGGDKMSWWGASWATLELLKAVGRPWGEAVMELMCWVLSFTPCLGPFEGLLLPSVPIPGLWVPLWKPWVILLIVLLL